MTGFTPTCACAAGACGYQWIAPITPGGAGINPLIPLLATPPATSNLGTMMLIGSAITQQRAQAALLAAETEAIRNQQPAQPYIGINTVDVSEKTAKSWGLSGGALVRKVYAPTAASAAHLKKGDVITEWGGVQVAGAAHLHLLVQTETEIGKPLKVQIYRKGKPIEVTIIPVRR